MTIFTKEPYNREGRVYMLVPAETGSTGGCSTCAFGGSVYKCLDAPKCFAGAVEKPTEVGYFKEVAS